MLARGFLRSLGKSEMTQNVLVHEQVQLSFQKKVQIVFPRKNWEIPKVVENVTKLRLTHGRWLPPRGSKRRARPWKRPPTSSLNPLLLSNWGRISQYRNITFLRVQVFNGFIGISQYRNITFRESASAQWFYRYLQTLTQISAEKNSTIIFPLPMGRIFVLSFYHKLEEHFKGMVYKRNHI